MGYESEQDSESVSSSFQDEHDTETCIIRKEKKHKCTYANCNATFFRPSKLERHMRQHTGERPYICNKPGCTKSYSSSCHLKRHLKTHDPIQLMYKCPQCLTMVINICNLKRHFKEQHGKDNVFCGDCGEMFHKKYQLTKHRNTVHLKPIDYKCDKCAKIFSDITALKRHKKNHEKSYPCSISGCSEVFYKWSLMRKHQGTHVIEYKCNICDKIFSKKWHLSKHSKTHTDIRVVTLCPYEKCKKPFYYKSNLEQHIKTKHLGKKYYCDICSVGLTAKRKLIFHIKRYHSTTQEDSCVSSTTANKKRRKRRKDIGVPKKSIIGKLIGCNFPYNIEKQLMKRETTIKTSESPDKSSSDIQIELVEHTS